VKRLETLKNAPKDNKSLEERCIDAKPVFEEGEDPFQYLGFGTVSYFNLIKTLILTFLVLTLVNIPTIRIYKSY
jgi:hypothetical protein